jgi:hypothetical protein
MLRLHQPTRPSLTGSGFAALLPHQPHRAASIALPCLVAAAASAPADRRRRHLCRCATIGWPCALLLPLAHLGARRSCRCPGPLRNRSRPPASRPSPAASRSCATPSRGQGWQSTGGASFFCSRIAKRLLSSGFAGPSVPELFVGARLAGAPQGAGEEAVCGALPKRVLTVIFHGPLIRGSSKQCTQRFSSYRDVHATVRPTRRCWDFIQLDRPLTCAHRSATSVRPSSHHDFIQLGL